ncbi:MAG: hypothetical protein KDC34_19070 [Saprospiraceae bacterium]|nr:hypothetical protein [Saprospiraceae bacterium]
MNKKTQTVLMDIVGVGVGYFAGQIIQEQLDKAAADAAEPGFLTENPLIIAGAKVAGGTYLSLSQKGFLRGLGIGIGANGVVTGINHLKDQSSVGYLSARKSTSVHSVAGQRGRVRAA